MTTIHELIERVEKLTGPDREVDALIHVVSGNATDLHVFAWSADPAEWCSFGARAGFAAALRYPNEARHYTASFDAAIALARDQHEFMEMLGEAYHEILPPSGTQFAIKYNDLRSQMVTQFPAIKAALLRALRARAEQEKK